MTDHQVTLLELVCLSVESAAVTIDSALIKSSFAAVEPRGSEITTYFYAHLFEHNPDVRKLFAEHLDEQQDRLWAALTTLVDKLDDTDTVVAVLQGLGRRHAGYGALPAHFPAVGASLLAALAHVAGDAWTPAAEASWTALYGVVAEVMGGALTEAATG
ncbi:globin domain-containing protein [Kitasatospora sp. CB02891]|uniref:globin domain-containing protein n=1 Tax=Kitasatospora sp. CB02891 TaxID=2020329 RepID=UPI0012FD85E0|nr:globin domain-containing protein [Kitasatospora sp. CB02891]